MKQDLTFLRPLVIKALTAPDAQWTVQGFGFLRTYFGPPDQPKRFRLNLWDSRFTVPNVSTIHDHPWDFRSVIVAGQFCNVRYKMAHVMRSAIDDDLTHSFTTIKTGEGGGLEKDPTRYCTLHAERPELYGPGDIYFQSASEIHETCFKNGSVTLNERTIVGDGEHARVFWPFGTDWVDAMPRPATPAEVSLAIQPSLAEWF